MAERLAPGEIQEHRAYLYRYALPQVRDANRAEDVVQETLLAAIEGGDGYAGRSSVKTWLTGILKHKITDLFRKQSREAPVPAAPGGEDEREFADEFFDQADTDHWHAFPPAWQDPERSFEQTRFWEVFERWRLSVHLEACAGCRNFQQQMSFLRKAFRHHPVIRDGENK
jgi:RNA polymerase sigma-70 factor (ECF subfamily)